MQVHSRAMPSRPGDPEFYRFHDAVTGLTLDLPASWERLDPADAVRVMAATEREYLRRSAGPRGTGVIAIARLPDFAGPEKHRPMVACMTGPAPSRKELTRADARSLFEHSIRSTLPATSTGVISPVTEFEIDGHPVFRVSLTQPEDAPGSGTFMAILQAGQLINCFGVHDERTRAIVGRSLESIRFEATESG